MSWRKIALGFSVAASVAACALELPPVQGPESPREENTKAASGPAAAAQGSPGDALLLPLKVEDLYQPGEIRVFDFVQQGQRVGRAWGRYEGAFPTPTETVTPTGTGQSAGEKTLVHRFRFQAELKAPSSQNLSTGLRVGLEIELDAKGRLQKGWSRGPAGEIRFRRTSDELLVVERLTGLSWGNESGELSYPQNAALMAFMAPMLEEMMVALQGLPSSSLSWRLLNLSTGTLEDWSAQANRVTSKTRNGDSVDRIWIDSNLGEAIEWSDKRIRSIEIEDDELRVTEAPESDQSWPDWQLDPLASLNYEVPKNANFTRREVEIPGQKGEPKLVGEVLVPKVKASTSEVCTVKGAVNARATHDQSRREECGSARPAVLFIAGGNGGDRYGFAGPPAVDLGSHQISDHLAQAGFVVLRYDPRGTGSSGSAAMTFVGQTEDARRALRTLMVQPEVDPDRILLVGHGEGGWIAIQLAGQRSREIKGVALLASPGENYRKRFAQQPELIAAIESGVGLPENLAPFRDWYREILDVQPHELLAKTTCPYWLAQGEKDFETDGVTALSAWELALRSEKLRYQIKRYPQLDHLFKVEMGVSNPASYLNPRSVDPGFLEDLRSWATEILIEH